jgi:Xaa-Pro aminopeptidase
MLDRSTFIDRRRHLCTQVTGPILLMGNGERSRNLPMNKLPFRQDSTFLYFTGCQTPAAAALIDDGHCTLFLPEVGEDDALWHGPTPSHAEIGAAAGADAVHSLEQLTDILGSRKPRVLAVADEGQNAFASQLGDVPLRFGTAYGDRELVDAIIALRRPKSDAELDEMRRAAALSKIAHEQVMAATHPGGTERALAALFHGILAANNCDLGYGIILTQRGEVLHNHDHSGILEAGRLVLLDGGGEVPSGYGVDITRTWPVSGQFSPRQKAVYEAVLEAQIASIAACTRGTWYREVHDASSRVLARFLADEGFLRCSPDEAVETGAHALFFPHGVGHHLGLDVHDLENFGDLPSYPAGRERPDQFGTENLRLDLPLEDNWVVTIEPGLYFVEPILTNPRLRTRFKDIVDFEKAMSWLDFGGIRIEDDIRIDDTSPEILTHVAKTVGEIEALVGTRPCASHHLSARG